MTTTSACHLLSIGPFKNYPQITVYHPKDQGHPFANIGWTGWIGSITGMYAHIRTMSVYIYVHVCIPLLLQVHTLESSSVSWNEATTQTHSQAIMCSIGKQMANLLESLHRTDHQQIQKLATTIDLQASHHRRWPSQRLG